MGDALSVHDQIVDSCVTRGGGRIIKHTGDGVFAVFDEGQPLQCALDIQRQVADTDWGPIGRLRVRIALHAGEAERRDNDFFGSAVNRTARLLLAAWGGQILLSEEVARVFETPEGSALHDYGVHMLKDLGHPQQIYGLIDLRLEEEEFPPLRSLSTRSHNLPPQPTRFIGRHKELAEILERLDSPNCRLLTIVGPGGVGKTRLALQVAAENIDAFPHGVYQVSLAPLAAGSSIITTIAEALHFPFSGSELPAEQLWRYLKDKEMLLVLDNFEHLMEGVGSISDIVQNAHRLKLIVTSRERLNLHEEWTYELHGMEVPGAHELQSAEQFSSVRLFLQNVYRINPDFTLNDEEKANIIRVCELVEGIPLGIELAASWIRVLSCGEIAAEIERSRDFLFTSAMDVPERHQSLRAVFDYSWRLLSSRQQDVLRRLAVFRGGMPREAAEQVAGATLPLLLALTDKSLLRRTPSGRYQMLEAVRDYAYEKLAEEPDVAAETESRHASFFINLLLQYGSALTGGRQREALAILGMERANGRKALKRVMAVGDVELSHQVLDALFHLYEIRGWMQEGFDLFSQFVEALRMVPPSRLQVLTHAMALCRRGWFAYRLGRHQEAEEDMRRSLAIFQEWDEPAQVAIAFYNLGVLTYQLGDYVEAEQLLHRGLDMQKAEGERFGTARALSILGIIARDQGLFDRARSLLEESLALHRELEEKRGISRCLNLLALLHRDQGELEQARLQMEESLVMSRDIDDVSGVAYALSLLGVVHHELGDYIAARDYAQDSLAVRESIGDRRGLAFSHNDLGRALMMLERYDSARDHFRRALAAAEEIRARPISYYILANLAELERREDHLEVALRLAALVIASGTSFEAAVTSAQLAYDRITPALAPERIAAIWEEVTPDAYDAVLGELLGAGRLKPEAERSP
jgi:predicted ATPase